MDAPGPEACARCTERLVDGARFCHRCGRRVGAPPRAVHVASALAVVALLVAAWAVFPGPATAPAAEAHGAGLLVPVAALPDGLVVPPLPSSFADALGVTTNPSPLPVDAVDGFAEAFALRPETAWVQFVAREGDEADGVLLFSFRFEDDDAGAAAAAAFVAGGGCRDVDAVLAGERDVLAVVAVGARYAELGDVVDAVVRALAPFAPALEEACPRAAPSAEGAVLAMEPAGPVADGAPLAVLVHRGGPALAWDDHAVRALRDGRPTVAITFALEDCAEAALAPSGTFASGDRLLLCAADDAWAAGQRLDVRVTSRADGAVVFEGGVALG